MPPPDRHALARLKGKLGAETKRANDAEEYSLQCLREESELKSQLSRVINIAVIAVLALKYRSQIPGEVSYAVAGALSADLLKECPGVAGRLGEGGKRG